jgi:hypothetical protein
MQTSGGQILKGLGGVGILGKQTDDGASSHWGGLGEGEGCWSKRKEAFPNNRK